LIAIEFDESIIFVCINTNNNQIKTKIFLRRL